MKAQPCQVWLKLALVIISFGESPLLAQEGWAPVGPPNITNIDLQTVGGITYFTHTSRVEGCARVASGPVTRSGTNLFQTINEEVWMGACGCDFCVHSETHASVFGSLPAGNYFLQLSSTAPFPHPFRWIGFTVSDPDAQKPTLQVYLETNSVKVTVAGISNVTYSVDASSTLSNWTAVWTNTGGPFVWSEPIKIEPRQNFYRVRISGQ